MSRSHGDRSFLYNHGYFSEFCYLSNILQAEDIYKDIQPSYMIFSDLDFLVGILCRVCSVHHCPTKFYHFAILLTLKSSRQCSVEFYNVVTKMHIFTSLDLTETAPAALEGLFPGNAHTQIRKKPLDIKKKKTKHSTRKIFAKKVNEWKSALHRHAQLFR